jgi:integrase
VRGNITRRGKQSWRLKFDIATDGTGKRQTRYVTIKGKRQDAERELTRLLNSADSGTLVEPSRVTVAEYLLAWLDGPHDLSTKTAERYRELAERQVIPHLGSFQLQQLRPKQIADWHGTLLATGKLSPRTVGHAHRVLHRALARAVASERISRNVAAAIPPPKVEAQEVEILTPEQVKIVLDTLRGHWLYPIGALALATGVRRGELLGLQIRDLNLDAATLTVQRSLEETKAGLRLKPPKTKHGRRTISLPPGAVALLRAHWRQQLEYRVALGIGKPSADAFVFSKPDGAPLSPDNVSRDWIRVGRSLGLPRVRFHALRHTHASALIAGGLDVVQVARRLGHGSPVVTLRVYGHLFGTVDTAAASAIENLLRLPGEG